MNKIRQHIPAYVDTDQRFESKFNTTEELLNVGWIKNFENFFHGQKFERFAKDRNMLVAEYSEGSFWWVVGYIEKPEHVDLPLPRYKGKNG